MQDTLAKVWKAFSYQHVPSLLDPHPSVLRPTVDSLSTAFIGTAEELRQQWLSLSDHNDTVWSPGSLHQLMLEPIVAEATPTLVEPGEWVI
jgi:hypothetical protein